MTPEFINQLLTSDVEILYRLGLALALGLIIGLERGWKSRNIGEGRNVAGLRTYGLTGLLGGVWALVAMQTSLFMLGFAFLGLALVVIAAYFSRIHQFHDIGTTSVIASLLTFALGALAMLGHGMAAVSVAIITTLLLDLKPQLHRWVAKLAPEELKASLKMLLISVVLLPILPDRGYGPWEALNPYAIWWMVVLITGISFVGYFAMKIGGTRQGAVLTGITGGLASSTAATLSLSRLAQKDVTQLNALASGILAACGTMFPRILLIATIINPALFLPLLWPLTLATTLTYLAAFLFWRKSPTNHTTGTSQLSNPFQFGMALRFTTLLVVILLLAKGLQNWYGDTGLYMLAAVSGLSDVDAITLSVSRMSQMDITQNIAVTAIFIAAVTNTLIKSALSIYIGGLALGLRVSLSLLGAILLGFLGVVLTT